MNPLLVSTASCTTAGLCLVQAQAGRLPAGSPTWEPADFGGQRGAAGTGYMVVPPIGGLASGRTTLPFDVKLSGHEQATDSTKSVGWGLLGPNPGSVHGHIPDVGGRFAVNRS